jgi:ligand-binding SRPBCC domain-containing protein
MKLHQIHRKQMIPISIFEAWEFFSNPENLSTITPSWLNLTLISDIPRGMHSGMIISYRITPIVRVPTIWISEITHVNRPTYFVDEQRLGPFRFWHHQHVFKEVGRNVEIQDIVHYAMPLGPIGEMMYSISVRKKVDSIFDFRQKALERILS